METPQPQAPATPPRSRLLLGDGDAPNVVTRRATDGPLTAVMFIADHPGQRVAAWDGSTSICLALDPDGRWRVTITDRDGPRVAASGTLEQPADGLS